MLLYGKLSASDVSNLGTQTWQGQSLYIADILNFVMSSSLSILLKV